MGFRLVVGEQEGVMEDWVNPPLFGQFQAGIDCVGLDDFEGAVTFRSKFGFWVHGVNISSF